MLMGKNSCSTRRYATVVQLLLLLLAAISTPLWAFNFVDLELFCVCKTLFFSTWASIKPWLCPPYVYLLLNFIIFFIAASSSLHSSSNSIAFDPRSPADHFIESTLVCQGLAAGFLPEREVDFNTSEGAWKTSKEAEPTYVIKKELRKSETFNEGGGRLRFRRDKYVRILSQEELNRRVEAFIHKCNKDMKHGV